MPRVAWRDLPGEVRSAVAGAAGPVLDVTAVEFGFTCSLAARLDTADGPVFVKGAPDAEGRAGQRWEQLVAPVAGAVSPALRWRVEAAGWEVLGFDWVDGRHADLSPGSADLPLVARALTSAATVRAPHKVPQLAVRLASFLDAEEARLLAGGMLLHTDTNPHNLLVGGGRAWLVDWAMPAAGPAWVDAACTAVRLMEDGATAGQALDWLDQFSVWTGAHAGAVAAFVAGTCRQWEAQVGRVDCLPSNGRFRSLLAGARV
ncbi:aminoglycoside phosphotransferase [Streptomyces sp. NPDC046465]|uniref:aminoglycoside phosphotransferase n=1 Tax=Streptomyces sp. NPDC046465 TaxID=3155810 RepID=UPI0033C9DA0E